MSAPLLMIPGPVELSPNVLAASAEPPRGHTAPDFIALFGRALSDMRAVWKAGPDHQPFLLAGSGTLAMEMAVQNVLEPGQRAVVVDTGYFSRRMAEILARRGVAARSVGGRPGEVPSLDEVSQALAQGPVHALFLTHVDTSTGVLADVQALARLARQHHPEILVVVDGVCSVGGEALEQQGWGLDVVLTASQKALSAPPGLALAVASPRALAARERLSQPPMLAIDWKEWLPIHQAYEAGRPSYFATPATGLVRALQASLQEIVEEGVDAAIARHRRAATAMRAAFAHLGLQGVPAQSELAAHTLSALWIPDGLDRTFPARVAARGVLVAGGLHPDIARPYLRVGHLGQITGNAGALGETVRAVGLALADAGQTVDVEGAAARLQEALKTA